MLCLGYVILQQQSFINELNDKYNECHISHENPAFLVEFEQETRDNIKNNLELFS